MNDEDIFKPRTAPCCGQPEDRCRCDEEDHGVTLPPPPPDDQQVGVKRPRKMPWPMRSA